MVNSWQSWRKFVQVCNNAFSSCQYYIIWAYQHILSLKIVLIRLMKFIVFIVYLLLNSFKINYKNKHFMSFISAIFLDKMWQHLQNINYSRIAHKKHIIAIFILREHFWKVLDLSCSSRIRFLYWQANALYF